MQLLTCARHQCELRWLINQTCVYDSHNLSEEVPTNYSFAAEETKARGLEVRGSQLGYAGIILGGGGGGCMFENTDVWTLP